MMATGSRAVHLLLAASIAGASCNATLDPPTLTRNGLDIIAQPLPASASIGDCIAMCCAISTCVAFSYNNPQPEYAALGGSVCELGGVCCMIKSGVPAQSNNTYGAAVQTGVMLYPPAAPGPVPPFPRSTLVTNVSLDASSLWHWSGNGDTWPTAWAADGSTFGWCCDSQNDNQTGTPMSMWRIDGNPYNGTLQPVLLANEPIDYMDLCAPYHPGQYVNSKPGGMVEYNGTLYSGVSCITYGQDSTLFIRQHNLAGFIAASDDRGVTWRNVTAVGALPGRFAAPAFVSCGPGTPCPDSDPTSSLLWTYVFFAGAANDDFSYWENGDSMFLARVAPHLIPNVSTYQYWTGISGGARPRPQWSPDATQAQPIMLYGRMMGENAVHYNSYLKRYIMANYGFINPAGNPWPWHQLSWTQYNNPRRTQLLMLEAPQPYGPWSVFYQDDDAGSAWGAGGMYTPTFPAAFHRPITANDTADMIMFFACGLGGPQCYYTLNHVRVTLTLANATAGDAPA